MDTVDRATRSRVMSRVKSKETKLEKAFLARLWRAGVRYRKRNDAYFGKPDILLKGKRLVLFIDSCFWHGCGEHLRMPTSNQRYWQKKIDRNRARDEAVRKHYIGQGWTIIRVWEHDVRDEELMDRLIRQLKEINSTTS
jgi:DNA mismatch endonuclease (patch repair protein)